MYVPGCPPKPEQIIDAVVVALGKVKAQLEQAEHPAEPEQVANG